ncbi:MAG: ribonuclease III [Myxococcota bacterium]|nr:ribonuclease III [Myxococcota bacterium]
MGHEDEITRLEGVLGHVFQRRDLLEEALTHTSFANEEESAVNHNERLEYLGDAVLDLMIGHWLFQSFPDWPEGRLTQTRAGLVNTEALRGLAVELGLGQALRMGVGEERTGGRERASVLAGGLEAVIGALYLDAGFESCLRLVRTLFQERMDHQASVDLKDPKSRLQEWAQGVHRVMPQYSMLNMTGPPHAAVFEVEVVVGKVLTAAGRGRSKKEAEMDAARVAWESRPSE